MVFEVFSGSFNTILKATAADCMVVVLSRGDVPPTLVLAVRFLSDDRLRDTKRCDCCK